MTDIEDEAFKGCTNLKSITIPDNVTDIGDYAFSDCTSLESIKIPNSVTDIGCEAFSDCTSLNSVTIHEKKPEKTFALIRNASLNNISDITLNVPIGTGYAYKHHPYFAKFKEIIANVR